jgi:hypothetical protein
MANSDRDETEAQKKEEGERKRDKFNDFLYVLLRCSALSDIMTSADAQHPGKQTSRRANWLSKRPLVLEHSQMLFLSLLQRPTKPRAQWKLAGILSLVPPASGWPKILGSAR